MYNTRVAPIAIKASHLLHSPTGNHTVTHCGVNAWRCACRKNDSELLPLLQWRSQGGQGGASAPPSQNPSSS